jgi:hypothetical protein
VNEDIQDALDQAHDHRRTGNGLFALSLVFLTATVACIANHNWWAVGIAAFAAWAIGTEARREWGYQAQWEFCAELWAEEAHQ